MKGILTAAFIAFFLSACAAQLPFGDHDYYPSNQGSGNGGNDRNFGDKGPKGHGGKGHHGGHHGGKGHHGGHYGGSAD